MAINAGADLVLGSGPHVCGRWSSTRGRLIAYSLGDFAGYHNFTTEGVLGISAILRVGWTPPASGCRARSWPVRLVGAGQPVLDPSARAASGVISQLSREDIGARAARLSSERRDHPARRRLSRLRPGRPLRTGRRRGPHRSERIGQVRAHDPPNKGESE